MKFELALPNKPLNSIIFEKENLGLTLSMENEKLIVSGDCTKEQAQAALNAHNPPAPKEPTVAEKLASVGLSIEELKAALA